MSKKDEGTEDAQDFSGMPASATVTAADIQQKEFRVSRFGGYRMRDVDEFLDQITETMTKLSEENARLRSASGLPAAPAVLPMGAPDLADTSRQADEIIRRARAEAASILQEAREQTASGGPGTDAGRAAVAAFLSQEKEFLQQLASLVQGHAESVKGMAKASRATAKPAPSAEPSTPAPASTASTGTSPQEPTATVAPAPAPQKPVPVEPSSARAPDARAADARSTEPIRVQEPATASVTAGDADDEKPGGDGDPTLRELFWGEE